MEDLSSRIEETDWNKVTADIHEKSYAVVPKFLTEKQYQDVIDLYANPDGYRKTVREGYCLDFGEYKYFDYPLPKIIQTMREEKFPKLAPITNLWMKVLKIEKQFTNSYYELQTQCHDYNQLKPTPLPLKYGKGALTPCTKIYMVMSFFPYNWNFS